MRISRRQGLPVPFILFPFFLSLYINKVYSQISSCGADPVVWVCTADGKLCWGNLATGAERMVGSDPGHFMLDLAWAADGKLYGVGGSPSGIFEIDPATALATFKAALPAPFTGPGNSMASDREGNLYLAASLPDPFLIFKPQIIRLNIATWQTCVIVPDLRSLNLSSAGDLTFINGFLYLSSGGNKIARINIHTGAVETKDVINSTTGGYFGLTTIGDGFLYASDRGKIYRIDPNSMTAETTPVFTFSFPNLFMNGLATHAEPCNAPRCPASVKVQSPIPPPFCSQMPLMVTTGTSCFAGAGKYVWTRPDGTIAHGTTITAGLPGKYVARYQATPDTCSAADSITITFVKPPSVDLGPDTSLCITEDLYLKPVDKTGIIAYRWQDGSTGERLYAEKTGWYWLDATASCGVIRDSVYVNFKDDGCAKLIYIPSAFTPNQDGLNDIFKPVIKNTLAEYEFSVFNRWGQRVFTTHDVRRGWDGTINGQQQNAGLFTWYCRYRLNRKPAQTMKGIVTLVR